MSGLPDPPPVRGSVPGSIRAALAQWFIGPGSDLAQRLRDQRATCLNLLPSGNEPSVLLSRERIATVLDLMREAADILGPRDAEITALLSAELATLRGEDARPAGSIRQMAAALREYAEWFGSVHETACPKDDTCACSGKRINDGINGAVRYLEALEAGVSPDAAGPTTLHRELRKRGLSSGDAAASIPNIATAIKNIAGDEEGS